MKHIGVMAHSAEGSALCYLTICHAAASRLGAHRHPEITMSIIAMGEAMAAWRAGDLGTVRNILSTTADRLAAAGCDFFICPDNTAHIALESPGPDLALPGLHIAEVVCAEAKEKSFKTLGLLGTNWTMEGPVYRAATRRAGFELIIPDPEDRAHIDRIIFDELCNGDVRDAAREEYLRIIADLKAAGCDAVILGCTEIPLLVTPEASPLPTLDSTRLLAGAAVAVALGAPPLPNWRGGAIDG